ncbi:sensor histidine kinase [Enterococcus faecalis]
MMIVFIIIITFLNSLSICSLFFKLTLSGGYIGLRDKGYLILCMNLAILIFGFSPFALAQIPACGVLLLIITRKFENKIFDFKAAVFMISFIFLLITLINYFEGLIAKYLSSYFYNEQVMYFIISLAFQILNLILIISCPNKIYRLIFRAINTNTFYKITFVLIFSNLSLFVVYTVTKKSFGLSLETFMALITLGIFVTFGLINYDMQRQEQKNQKELMNNLAMYTKEIEAMYDELSMFRHDYSNILFSLRMAIEDRDIDLVEKIFKESIMQTEKIVNSESGELTKINQVEIPEVKSLLYAKLNSARMKGLEISIDIPNKVYKLEIETITYIRILSILLDNALENANQSIDKKISIAIFEHENKHFLVIGNSIKKRRIDLEKIFEKSFSSKTNNDNKHGWGLYYLKSIVSKTDKITLETKLEDSFFSQVIRIKKDTT